MRIRLYLLFILLLCFILRIYNLDKIPNSLSGDEVAFGYNAYSILTTGKDEFGYKYPIYFRSFDDYKNPVYGYVLIPFIRFFGLNAWSIRIPSVISGTVVVGLFYLITKKLTNNEQIALLTALFATISPWLIQYSRVAIEMELAVCLSMLGVWLFIKGREQNLFYFLSGLTFGLAFYTYHSSKVWILGFGLILIFLNRKINRYILLGLLLFGIIILPYLYQLISSKIALRPYAISVFSNQEEIITDAKLNLSDKTNGILGGNLFHNRRFTYINQAVNGYLHVLNPAILFSQSGANQIPLTRLLYLWQFPLIFVGVYLLIKKRQFTIFLFSWLIIGFIPGGLTVLPPFDRRILIISFPLLLFSAYGLYFFIYSIRQKFRKLIIIGTAVIIGCSVTFFIHNYFVHGPDTVVELWGNGMKEIVMETESAAFNFKEVNVSIKLNQPLMFFLFYTQYPPEKYLAEGGTISGGYLDERNKFDKYRFRNFDNRQLKKDTLYVWSASDPQPCLKPFRSVFQTNGTKLANIGIYFPEQEDCNINTNNKI